MCASAPRVVVSPTKKTSHFSSWIFVFFFIFFSPSRLRPLPFPSLKHTSPPSSTHQNALLAEATESFDKGCAAIKSGDMDEAITLLARALEVRTEAYGDKAIECASAYYKYGCALLQGAG